MPQLFGQVAIEEDNHKVATNLSPRAAGQELNLFAEPRDRPAILLVDDDFFSARQTIRWLAKSGASAIRWIDADSDALAHLADATTAGLLPDLVVVDLKSSSRASAEFVAQLRAGHPGVLVVAMASTLGRRVREDLLAAGAAAVFERSADLVRFSVETRAFIEFWRREGVVYEMAR